MGEAQSRRSGAWRLVAVLVAGWVVRAAYLAWRPGDAVEMDARYWGQIADILRAGGNPYVLSNHLNYPPFWVVCLWGMMRVADGLGVGFQPVLWATLILAESVVVALLWRWMGEVGARRTRPLLLGVALNPAMVFQVCQHGNFDVVMAIWVVLFGISLARFERGGSARDWLWACGALGMGILTKTVPVVLLPLLASGVRRVPGRTRAWGGLLALGPVALGMAVILAMAPGAVWENVVKYRSITGWFGVTGLMRMAGLGRGAADAYGTAFSMATVLWLLFGSAWLARRGRLGNVALWVGTAMLVVPALGPGYGSQYVWWYWPGMLVAFATPGMSARWRRVAGAAAVVLVASYCAEYLRPHRPQGAAMDMAAFLRDMDRQTLARLPLFVAMLAVLIESIRALGSTAFRETEEILPPGNEENLRAE